MFKDNPNITKLADEIYLYKNFLSQDEAATLHELALSLSEEEWKTENVNKWHEDKGSKSRGELKFLYNRLNDLISPEYTILPSTSFQRLRTGQDMYVHADSPGEENPDDVSSNDTYCTCHIVKYGLVVYINDDFLGGEIFYPRKGIEYKPVSGDLLIHSSSVEYDHGVREVLSGTRFIYPNFMFDAGAAEVPSI